MVVVVVVDIVNMRNDIHSAIQITNVVAFSTNQLCSTIWEIGLFYNRQE